MCADSISAYTTMYFVVSTLILFRKCFYTFLANYFSKSLKGVADSFPF